MLQGTKKPSTIGDMGLRLAHGWIVWGIIACNTWGNGGRMGNSGDFSWDVHGNLMEFDAFNGILVFS